MADERSNGGKSNANSGQKKSANETTPNGGNQGNAVATATAAAVSGANTEAGPLRSKIAYKLGRMVITKQLREEHKLSRRNAGKLLDELESQQPTIWVDAMTAAGIEVGHESEEVGAGKTGKLFDGTILNWLMDPANQEKIMNFTKFVETFIKFLLPLFV